MSCQGSALTVAVTSDRISGAFRKGTCRRPERLLAEAIIPPRGMLCAACAERGSRVLSRVEVSARPPAVSMKAMTSGTPTPSRTWANWNGRSPRIRRASRSITSSQAPTCGARSVLLMISRSERVTPGPPLRGILSPARDVDDIEGEIGELGREGRRQVVAADLDQDQVEVGEAPHQVVDGGEVDRGVLADRGVRAAAGLDPDDALERQRLGAHQELGVLAGVDVVGDRGDRLAVAHPLAELVHQRGLAGADRAADADAQGSVGGLVMSGRASSYLGFVRAWRRDRREAAMPPISSSGAASAARRRSRAASGIRRGGDALAVGLADRDQPHPGRDDVGGEGLDEERRGQRARQAEQPRGVADRDRVGHRRHRHAPGGGGGPGEGRALAVVSRCRSAEGASASASSASGAGSSARWRGRAGSRRCGRRRIRRGRRPRPRARRGSVTSPASTAHSSPCE